MMFAAFCICDIACQFDDDDSDFDDDYDEDFLPPAPLLDAASYLQQQYGDSGSESIGIDVLESRGMKGKKGSGSMNMSMFMINATQDEHEYEKDDEDDHDFEEKEKEKPRFRNCNFKLPDKVIGMKKVVYIPRITIFDTDHDADVVTVKGEFKKVKKSKCKGCKKKKKSKMKRKKKKKKGK